MPLISKEMLEPLLKKLGIVEKSRRVNTEKQRSRHSSSNNHSVSTPKKRVKMAKESNKINRKRCKRWKH